MSRIKLILLSLLAVGAVSALGSASASASCGGLPATHWVWCNDASPMEELGTPPTLFLGLGGLQLLTGVITGVEAKFHCKDVHVEGKLELLGAATFALTYLGCKQVMPSACKLAAAQETEIKTATLTGQTEGALPGGPPKVLVKGAGAEEEFATLETLKPTGCNIPAGKYKVTGLQLVELPEPESMKVEHELVALAEEPSKLKLGGNEAFYVGSAKVHLLNGLAFGLLPGT